MSRRRSLRCHPIGTRVSWQYTWYMDGQPRTYWKHGTVVGHRGDKAVIAVEPGGHFLAEVWEPLLHVHTGQYAALAGRWTHAKHRRTVGAAV